MKTNDISISLLVDQSPEQVFEAVKNVQGWWSKSIVGKSAELNDEFAYEVKGIHFSRQRLVEVVPAKRIVWQVTESNMSFLEDTDEWTGTRVIFDISRSGDQTELLFTHEGLHPGVECYDKCQPAWTQYIRHSLLRLVTTGKGDPNLEGRRIEALD